MGGLLQTKPGLGCLHGGSISGGRSLTLGLPILDNLLPDGVFHCGAMHEVLHGLPGKRSRAPLLMPALLARAAVQSSLPGSMIAWCDMDCDLYPRGLQALGIPMNRLMVLRPKTAADALWAVTECLRCKDIAACIMPASKLSRVQARRIQLAAERGGGIGVLLRPVEAVNWPHAAVTRWKVTPARGERMVQRVTVELIHGHGGRVGKSVLLEVCRETNHVRAVESVANRPGEPQIATG